MRPAFGYRCGDITDFVDFYCAVTIKTNGLCGTIACEERNEKEMNVGDRVPFDS